MTERFNLCDEGWILVRNGSDVSEVSIKEALLNAHSYREVVGEIAGQDIALLRLLLAVLHTVFSRVDVAGNAAPIESAEDAFDRWKSIWEMGRFPAKPIEDYLEKWHERFYLIHPNRPFYQLATLNRGTSYSASKLNGEVSESENKVRLFSKYSGEGKRVLTFAQAARWLPYLISFDDTSSKPTKEGKANGSLPSTGAGWLGKLGLTIIQGRSLFETLMFNMAMVNGDSIENDEHPVWEADNAPSGERVEINLPNNLAELYTLQSRRVLLSIENDTVTGYKLIGGDFFPKENAFIEPMTIWQKPKKDWEPYVPKRHNIARKLWREFSTFYPEDNNSIPGVVKWYRRCVCDVLPKSVMMTTYISAVCYGDKDFFVDNAYSDSLSLSSRIILEETGRAWRSRINRQIENCDNVAKEIYKFANHINIACGGDSEKKSSGSKLQEQFYYRIDIPFRLWLKSIDPESDNEFDKLNELKDIVIGIVREIADDAVKGCDPSAFAGRIVGGGEGTAKMYYSVPKAMNNLIGNVYKVYENKEGKNDQEGTDR